MLANLSKIGVVILAAGRGTRLGCVNEPKVMLKIGDKPIISYIVETLKIIGFSKEQICLVVGFHAEKVKEYFGDSVSYAEQLEQKGTAHAAYIGMLALPKIFEQVLVLNGDDSAFYSSASLENFISEHIKNQSMVTLLSAETENPTGKIVRHLDGKIEIIEKEYLTEEQKKIKEISTGTFCFDRAWFEKIFPSMPQLRKLGEYGLPTAFATARDQGQKIQVVKLQHPSEWFGINTPEELAEATRRK